MILGRRVRLLIAGLVGALAVACASSPEATSSAVPAPRAFLGQLRPADLGRDLEAVQLVTVRRAENAITVEVRLSVRAGTLMLVAQDMLGQRLMTVQWTGEGIDEQRSPNLPAIVSPTGLLADLVALNWPPNAVRRALEHSGATLVDRDFERIISVGRDETMHANLGWRTGLPWNGRLSYRNVRAGYTVDVQSVEQP